MSLINDALKRANTSPKPAASSTTAAESAMVPVAAAPAPATVKPRATTPVGLIVAMVALAGVAGWFFLKWREASNGRPPVQATTSVPGTAPASPPETRATLVPAPPAAPPPQPATAASVAVATPPPKAEPAAPPASPALAPAPSPVPAPSPAPEPVVAVVPAPAPTPAAMQPAQMHDLKLQAIVFRMKNPSALINGRHVEVGDEVAGARVLEIQRTTVFVEWQGKRQPLTIR